MSILAKCIRGNVAIKIKHSNYLGQDMGFKTGYVALKDMPPKRIAHILRMEASGKKSSSNDFKMAILSLDNGWTILEINKFLAPQLNPKFLAKLSEFTDVVSCQVHEGIMVSMMGYFQAGRQVFGVEHNAEFGIEHLDEVGDLPAYYDDLKAEAFVDQKEIPQIDSFFEVPVSLAEKLVDYRYGQVREVEHEFHEFVHKQKQDTAEAKNQTTKKKLFSYDVITKGLGSLDRTSGIVLVLFTFFICILVGFALININVPQFIIPILLVPVCFFTSFLIASKFLGLAREFAIVQASMTLLIFVVVYFIQMFR